MSDDLTTLTTPELTELTERLRGLAVDPASFRRLEDPALYERDLAVHGRLVLPIDGAEQIGFITTGLVRAAQNLGDDSPEIRNWPGQGTGWYLTVEIGDECDWCQRHDQTVHRAAYGDDAVCDSCRQEATV